MKKIYADSYRNHQHEAEHGNLSAAILRNQLDKIKDGDVLIVSPELTWRNCYIRMTLATCGLGDGVTVDVGFVSLEAETEDCNRFGHADVLTAFAEGVNVASKTRKDVLLISGNEKLSVCIGEDVECGDQYPGFRHAIALTFHGDPADGSVIELIPEFVHYGQS